MKVYYVRKCLVPFCRAYKNWKALNTGEFTQLAKRDGLSRRIWFFVNLGHETSYFSNESDGASSRKVIIIYVQCDSSVFMMFRKPNTFS